METLYIRNSTPSAIFPFPRTTESHQKGHSLPYLCFPRLPPSAIASSPSKARPRVRVREKCRAADEDNSQVSSSSAAYAVLGVEPNCSPAQLKAAFRAKVKQFHPDVNKNGGNSNAMIRCVIQAYEILSSYSRSEIIERECLDPFEKTECEALDIFVNEVLCVGKGCPYSCVGRAPHAFTYVSSTGTARATSQGHDEDYQVQVAVSQCPRSCIHYVTPSQRIILEDLLDSILDRPYDTSAEEDLLNSLLLEANFENNRYQKPKKQAKASNQHVDWF